MPAQSIPTSLRDFLRDLSLLRKEKQVSPEEIRAVTKVHPHIIAEFEETGLNAHPLFNDVYVRAFVRSYAQTIDLSPDSVVALFDRAKEGTYNRELAVSHLGLSPDEIVHDEENVSEDLIDDQVSSEKFEVAAASSTRITWVAAETESSEEDVLQKAKNVLASVFSKESAVIQWAIVAICAGVGLLLIYQLLSSQRPVSESETTASGEQAALTPEPETESLDSVVSEASSVPLPPPEPVVLNDSLEVHVVAFTGKLAPFRAKVDSDLRRPYWLNVGDSILFRVGNRIVLEDNLDVMKILLEGHAYPIFDTDSTARVVITRDTAQAFLTLRN